ncbi:hypothetical protein LV89_02521 [Arcicella aurantiaca]|uniref:GDSL-like lipase/acylhydrolase family protein n=1 Tax=Arcicella aurantiaca TaxID=591202 RepID=A0A316ET56_9BACT|nr:hypothetical protein [Arcicella aurantiaca]PWK26350.1 hypothetical protein LV89_02521 [Arcicella aurantiaca]
MNTLKIIFLLLLLSVLGSSGLLLLDLLRGDGNGIVAGINFAPVAKYLTYAFLAYCFWYAFKQKIGWLQNVVMSGLMIFLTVLLLEWICGIVLKKQADLAPKIEGPTHSMTWDNVLGYKPNPDTVHTGTRTKDGKVIYSITYATDHNSLRVTPIDTTKPRMKYAQFFGCSMTFGEGVQSNETLPYYFAKFDSTYRPYNLAYSGYGPHQMLARLETNQLKNIVKEKAGVGFYIYINDHVNRVLGTMTNFSYNGGNAPYFHKVGSELKHDGLFKDSRKIRSLIFEKLLKSNILKLFKIGYPFKITDEDYELTAEVMAQSAKLFKEQFGNDNFYVIIYPTSVDSFLIINLLKQKGVKVLDYSKLFNPLDAKYAIPFDEHPTALANEVLIKQLVKDIN